MDGSSDPIVHIVAMTPSNILLLEETLYCDQPHTSNNLLQDLNEKTKELQDIGAKVIGCISDNENKMIKVREEFEKEHLVPCPGDPPHAIQLVIGDIIQHQSFSAVVAKANFITDKFKNTRCKQFLKIEKSLNRHSRLGIRNGCLTRWNSHFNMFKFLISNRSEIIGVILNKNYANYVTEELSTTVLDSKFWEKLEELVDYIEPLSLAIIKLQADIPISNVYSEWIKLEALYDDDSYKDEKLVEFILSSLNKRWDLISEDVHIASYLLDPRFRSESVNEQQLEDAERFYRFKSARESFNYETLYTEFIKFRSFQGVYKSRLNEENITLFFERLKLVNSAKLFANFALEILAIPQSCASVERTFSAIRRIHTWQRNKIGRKKLSKLVYIYVNNKEFREENLSDDIYC